VATGDNIKILKTPIAAPNANAMCERFLGSVWRERLDCLLLTGQRSISRVLKEYVDYFNCLGSHQGLPQGIPEPLVVPDVARQPAPVTQTPLLGNLHHSYQLAA
jgi:putative transposase